MTSIHSLIADAITDVDEWLDDHPGADDDTRAAVIREIIGSQVPSMTTTLFHLVVDDNALAFETIEREADSPFAALQEGVESRIWRAVSEHLESRDEDDVDDPHPTRTTGDDEVVYANEATEEPT